MWFSLCLLRNSVAPCFSETTAFVHCVHSREDLKPRPQVSGVPTRTNGSGDFVDIFEPAVLQLFQTCPNNSRVFKRLR